MALTADEKKWFDSFQKLMEAQGVDLKNPVSMMKVMVLPDLMKEAQIMDDPEKTKEEHMAAWERNMKMRQVPAFIQADVNGERMVPASGFGAHDVVDWLYENTLTLEEERIKAQNKEAVLEAQIKYLYENASKGRLYYGPKYGAENDKIHAIYVDKDQTAKLMEATPKRLTERDEQENLDMNEIEQAVYDVDSERAYLSAATFSLPISYGIDDLGVPYGATGAILEKIDKDQKEHPELYVSQQQAKERSKAIGATFLQDNFEQLVEMTQKQLHTTRDVRSGVEPLVAMQELGCPNLNPKGVYTTMDAKLKYELQNLKTAMVFKSDAVRHYVERVQSSDVYASGMEALERIAERVRAMEELRKQIPQENQVDYQYLTDRIEELVSLDKRSMLVERMRPKYEADKKNLDPEVAQNANQLFIDLDNVTKLENLVIACSYLSGRKAREDDSFTFFGDIPNEVKDYMGEHMSEWKPDEKLYDEAQKVILPQTLQFNFQMDGFMDIAIHDEQLEAEYAGMTEEQRLNKIHEELEKPDSPVTKRIQQKRQKYMEAVIAEQLQPLQAMRAFHGVQFSQCTMIDGVLVDEMYWKDERFSNQPQNNIGEYQHYFVEQMAKACLAGKQIDMFLLDQDGYFSDKIRVTGTGLPPKERKQPEPDTELRSLGMFYIKQRNHIRDLSPEMLRKLEIASGQLNRLEGQYIPAAEAVLEDIQKNRITQLDEWKQSQQTMSEQLVQNVKDADKSVWFGSNEYKALVQAVEEVQTIAQQMERGQEWDTEQMHTYRTALSQMKEKAIAYKTRKGDPKQYKEKTQKRIHVADDIEKFADAQLAELNEHNEQYLQRLTQETDMGVKTEYLETLYEAIGKVYDKGRNSVFQEEWSKNSEEGRILEMGGLSVSISDREDSVTANLLEYYRQTHGLTRDELNDVIFNNPEQLKDMLKDYVAFQKKNSVFPSKEDAAKPLLTSELKEHLKEQAQFYKKWYQSIAEQPIQDYFRRGDANAMWEIRSDCVNTINVSQNEQLLCGTYGKDYADAFGGLEEMEQIHREVYIRQALAMNADGYLDKNGEPEKRIMQKLAYEKIVSLAGGRMPAELSEDETAMIIGLTHAAAQREPVSEQFSQSQLRSYLDGTASASLKSEIERVANVQLMLCKDEGINMMANEKQSALERKVHYKKEACAERLYDAFTKGIAEKNAKTYESMQTVKVRNEFIQEAMKTNVVAKLAEASEIRPENEGQLVDEVIAEIAQNHKKEYEAEAERKAVQAQKETEKQVQQNGPMI